MPNQWAALDDVFHALANPTRREVLERLGSGPTSMTELAEPFDMALPSFLQHMQVLERCGVVRSQKIGRVRTYYLEPEPLLLAEHWLDKRRAEWESRLDQLDSFLTTLKDKQP
jgi:DNA-binding transcriptional ArsR family regulator